MARSIVRVRLHPPVAARAMAGLPSSTSRGRVRRLCTFFAEKSPARTRPNSAVHSTAELLISGDESPLDNGS